MGQKIEYYTEEEKRAMVPHSYYSIFDHFLWRNRHLAKEKQLDGYILGWEFKARTIKTLLRAFADNGFNGTDSLYQFIFGPSSPPENVLERSPNKKLFTLKPNLVDSIQYCLDEAKTYRIEAEARRLQEEQDRVEAEKRNQQRREEAQKRRQAQKEKREQNERESMEREKQAKEEEARKRKQAEEQKRNEEFRRLHPHEFSTLGILLVYEELGTTEVETPQLISELESQKFNKMEVVAGIHRLLEKFYIIKSETRYQLTDTGRKRIIEAVDQKEFEMRKSGETESSKEKKNPY